MSIVTCNNCNSENKVNRYFCKTCGSVLITDKTGSYHLAEHRMMRITENLSNHPHYPILWDDTIDQYAYKLEKLDSLLNTNVINLPSDNASDQIRDFLNLCHNPQFQIAFVGTIKTGKSTLINALLGHEYASMAVTPETAALTKFRSAKKDALKISFYSKTEWARLWASRTSGADAFMDEYNALNADSIKDEWVGHATIHQELSSHDIKAELTKWSTSGNPLHYFVKEIEVSLSTLPSTFPKQVVFVDTPGLSDPVTYRSEITKQYIKRANAVFVCIDANKISKEEIETISTAFSISSHNKSKVFLIATHWDVLNDPSKDWAQQKEYLITRLSGKAFFDSKELAAQNIMHSAAFIHILCRKYDTLENSEKSPVKKLAMSHEEMNISSLTKEDLTVLISDANVNTISNVISENLLKQYSKLLAQDIAKEYRSILHLLRRSIGDYQHELEEKITATDENLEQLVARLKAKEKDAKTIENYQIQLITALKSVEKASQQQLASIHKTLEKNAKQR